MVGLPEVASLEVIDWAERRGKLEGDVDSLARALGDWLKDDGQLLQDLEWEHAAHQHVRLVSERELECLVRLVYGVHIHALDVFDEDPRRSD